LAQNGGEGAAGSTIFASCFAITIARTQDARMPNSAAEKVQLLLLDVDGVLTDGSIQIDDHGVETKRFHVRDGTGIKIWTRLGFQIAIITGRRGTAVRHRANELGIQHLVQGSLDKLADIANLLNSLRLAASQVAMLGDDLPDLPLMKLVGYPMAVADAVPEVRELAEYVTLRPGGHAAVREAIEHLLQAKDRWGEGRALFD
jgi:YrbI family 3-deoxy-D-manno-octulosonate 8-phosphate phosphatase